MGIRPYQQQCLTNIVTRRQAGVRRLLVSMATGLGKTVTFGQLPAPEFMPRGKQAVIIAHQEELIDQAAEKVSRWNPTLGIEVEMAGRKANPTADVIVGSIQTLSRNKGARLQKINPARVHWTIVDEAHHSVAKSYVDVIEYLTQSPDSALVGFTATVNRTDGMAMGSVFDEIVYKYDMLDAISDGWLADVHGFKLSTGTDISGLSKKDFANDEKVSDKINNPHRNEMLVQGWLQFMWPRQTIFFTRNIKHAVDLAKAFQRQGIKAEAIWGNDPERQTKLAMFRSGLLSILFNAALLIEGFDMWQVEGIVPAAPIGSQPRLIQMVGRGTRNQEGIDNLKEWRESGRLTDEHKQNCLVMDPVDVFGRLSLATLPSLLGLAPNFDMQGESILNTARAIKKLKEEHPDIDETKLDNIGDFKFAAQQAHMWQVRFAEDVKGFSELQWRKGGDGVYRLLLPKNEFFRVTEDMVGKFNIEGIVNGKQVNMKGVASLAEAVGHVEQKVATETPDNMRLLGREAKWMKQPITDGQMQQLQRLRVPPAMIAQMNRGQAAAYLTTRFNSKG